MGGFSWLQYHEPMAKLRKRQPPRTQVLYTKAPISPERLLVNRALLVLTLVGLVMALMWLDRDGLKDRAEVTGARTRAYGRPRTNPLDFDTDRGGVGDGREVAAGSDPTDVRVGPRNARRMGQAL